MNISINKSTLVKNTLTENDSLIFALELGLLDLNRHPCPFCQTGIMNIEKGKVRKGIDLRYRCNKITCRKTESVFMGSIFYDMRIVLSQWFDLLYAFCEKKTYNEIFHEANVTDKTITYWFRKFDEIIANNTSSNIGAIGGRGLTVEIDETHLFTRKYHVGRVLVSESFWVVGCICRETKCIRLMLTEHRNRNVLHGFILNNINRETRIISDKWPAYNTISNHNYVHDSVNHTQNFVDPNDSTIHTNTIERLWRSLKEHLPINLRKVDLEKKLKTFVAMHNFGAKSVAEKFNYLIFLIKTL